MNFEHSSQLEVMSYVFYEFYLTTSVYLQPSLQSLSYNHQIPQTSILKRFPFRKKAKEINCSRMKEFHRHKSSECLAALLVAKTDKMTSKISSTSNVASGTAASISDSLNIPWDITAIDLQVSIQLWEFDKWSANRNYEGWNATSFGLARGLALSLPCYKEKCHSCEHMQLARNRVQDRLYTRRLGHLVSSIWWSTRYNCSMFPACFPSYSWSDERRQRQQLQQYT